MASIQQEGSSRRHSARKLRSVRQSLGLREMTRSLPEGEYSLLCFPPREKRHPALTKLLMKDWQSLLDE